MRRQPLLRRYPPAVCCGQDNLRHGLRSGDCSTGWGRGVHASACLCVRSEFAVQKSRAGSRGLGALLAALMPTIFKNSRGLRERGILVASVCAPAPLGAASQSTATAAGGSEGRCRSRGESGSAGCREVGRTAGSSESRSAGSGASRGQGSGNSRCPGCCAVRHNWPRRKPHSGQPPSNRGSSSSRPQRGQQRPSAEASNKQRNRQQRSRLQRRQQRPSARSSNNSSNSNSRGRGEGAKPSVRSSNNSSNATAAGRSEQQKPSVRSNATTAAAGCRGRAPEAATATAAGRSEGSRGRAPEAAAKSEDSFGHAPAAGPEGPCCFLSATLGEGCSEPCRRRNDTPVSAVARARRYSTRDHDNCPSAAAVSAASADACCRSAASAVG